MDNELFELCKEVYEKTGWTASGDLLYKYDKGTIKDVPLYTSDYLLEKLRIKHAVTVGVGTSCRTATRISAKGVKDLIVTKSDSPLKALLKLTIALHDAGELK